MWQFAVGTIDAFSFIATLSTCRRVGWAEPRRARGSRGCPARGGLSRVPLPRPWVRTSRTCPGCWDSDARVPSCGKGCEAHRATTPETLRFRGSDSRSLAHAVPQCFSQSAAYRPA